MSKKPLVSVCMTTASVDHAMTRRPESIYDLLRRSLANQTYDGPYEVVVADTMVDRLPREFGKSWGRAERIVLVKQVQHDRIAIAGARNTAGVYSRGELIVFVDDCTELLPSFLEAAVELHLRGKIPTRVYFHGSSELPNGKLSTRDLLRVAKFDQVDPVWRNAGSPTDLTEWSLSGNACGVYVMPTERLLQLNGFDENFDGNWGCEDIEFWTRFDRLKLKRVGRADLAVVRWAHGPTKPRATLRRCREAYAQWAYRSRRIEANRRLSDNELDQLRRAPPCTDTCGLCKAPDRAQQIQSYRAIPAELDLRALRKIYSARPSGIYLDPWR